MVTLPARDVAAIYPVGHGDLFSETKGHAEDAQRMGSDGGRRAFSFRFVSGVSWGFPGGDPSA